MIARGSGRSDEEEAELHELPPSVASSFGESVKSGKKEIGACEQKGHDQHEHERMKGPLPYQERRPAECQQDADHGRCDDPRGSRHNAVWQRECCEEVRAGNESRAEPKRRPRSIGCGCDGNGGVLRTTLVGRHAERADREKEGRRGPRDGASGCCTSDEERGHHIRKDQQPA